VGTASGEEPEDALVTHRVRFTFSDGAHEGDTADDGGRLAVAQEIGLLPNALATPGGSN
jgi:hypothetical protein